MSLRYRVSVTVEDDNAHPGPEYLVYRERAEFLVDDVLLRGCLPVEDALGVQLITSIEALAAVVREKYSSA